MSNFKPTVITRTNDSDIIELSNSEIASFHEHGILIVKNGLGTRLQDIRRSISAIARRISRDNSLPLRDDSNFDDGIKQLIETDRKKVSTIYEVLRWIADVRGVSGDKCILSILKQIMNSEMLYLNQNWMLSMKVPGEDFHDFPWHQDLPYTFSTPNGITIWQGLKDVNDNYDGSLEVIIGSHQKGTQAFKLVSKSEHQIHYNIELNDFLNSLPRFKIKVNAGDLVFFHTNLVHRSTLNNSKDIIWNFHYRFSDLLHDEAVDREWQPTQPDRIPAAEHPNLLPPYLKKLMIPPVNQDSG